MCLFTILLLLTVVTQAADTSPWLANTEHTITQEKYVDLKSYNKILDNRRGFDQGQQCRRKRIAIRSFTTVNMQYKEGCWYSTKIGLLFHDGTYLLQPGEEVAGHIKGNLLDTAILKPTANPDVFLDLQPDRAAGYGYFVRFRTLETVQFERTRHLSGAVTLNYASTESARIERTNGLMNVQDHFVWYSPDTTYMLVWTERGVLYKYDLETFKVLPVYMRAKPRGLLPGSAAISPNGRYVAVAIESTAYSDLIIADTETCDIGETQVIGQSAQCQTQSQKSKLAVAIPDYTHPSTPRFFDDHTLGFYHVVDPPTPTLPGISQTGVGSEIHNGLRALFTIQAHGTSRVENKYIALGDSFSSGEGAGDYDLGTDRPGVNMCHTSKNSYPYVLNNRLNLTDFRSVACSGAIIEDIWVKNSEDSKPIDLSTHIPGKTQQIRYIKPFRPNIVSVTISGNDIHFSDRLKYCIVSSPNCYSSYSKRKDITNEILRQHDRLVELYKNIIDTGMNTRLYVIGYPQIVNGDVGASCASNVQLNAYQRIMANDLINYFNAVIQHAAQQAGAFYVGTETALTGHRMCDGASAMIGINGITIGGQTGTIESLSKGMYHPNELGHELLANAIHTKTNGLTEPMPTPKSYSTPPQPEGYPFLGIRPDGVPPADLYYADLADTTTIHDTLSADYESRDYDIPIAPYTEYEASLHSEPVVLGSITSDGVGTIKGTLTIPDSVVPGMHELHLRGPGVDGNLIDVYQFIYVAASDIDFDGDGIPNNTEPCGIIEPSGNDVDSDGVDDACDATITPPPTETPDPALYQQADLSYKIYGSSPETSPPLGVYSDPRTTQGTTTSQRNPSNTSVNILQPATFSDETQSNTTSTPDVLSVSQNNQGAYQPKEVDMAPPGPVGNNNEKTRSSPWYMFILLFGVTGLLIISYSIYKYGKKAKS